MTIPLQLKEVGYSFDRPVLEAVSLDFPAGSFSAILGPNGAGKSTLVRLISGWYRPQQGQVAIKGQSLDTLSQKQIAQMLAVVEQEHLFTADLVVRDLVALGRLPHQSLLAAETEIDRQAIARALDRTGTEMFRERRISTLSGGERQRVRIAAALAQQTDILVLDEPTSHLDIKHQVELIVLLRSLVKDGLTVIAVLHDINLASSFCDTLIFLREGRVTAKGHPRDVVREEIISSVYDCPVIVFPHPLHGLPQVALVTQ